MSFIYNGGDQSGLTATMVPQHQSVIRGRVFDRDTSAPLYHVTVAILDHGEYGSASTDTNGQYDMVVNGGQTYTVVFTYADHVTVQRHAETHWLDYTVLPDVFLVQKDVGATVTQNSGAWQVVRGSQMNDGVGTDRRVTLLFAPGTYATNPELNGSSLTVHATELSVGDNGPGAMPGELPPQSGYTYAAEFGVDEADSLGLGSVIFKNDDSNYASPVYGYLENFIQTPLDASGVENVVPSGSYDRVKGAWQTDASGVNLCLYGSTGGMVDITMDPSCCNANCNTPMNYAAYGITDDERATLNGTYTTFPTQLWRVPINHFTPFDWNWSGSPPDDAISPPNAEPVADTPKPHPCDGKGSIIECENQVLGESLPVIGTPFSLNYRSETQNGYHPTITVPVAGSGALPSSLDHAEVEIQIAGQRHLFDLTNVVPNEKIAWSWDRTDAYGRPVETAMTAHIRVSYVYKPVMQKPTSFASFGSGPAYVVAQVRAQRAFLESRYYDVTVGAFDDKALGLGGWTLSPQHVYDTRTGVLWRGDGEKRTPNALSDVVNTVHAEGDTYGFYRGLAAAADGEIYASLFHTDGQWGAVEQIDGATGSLITQTSSDNGFADGVAATTVHVGGWGVAMAPNGDLVALDDYRVIRISDLASGTPRAHLLAGGVAGSGDRKYCELNQYNQVDPVLSYSPDGAAVGAKFHELTAVTVARDGTTLFVEGGECGVRLVRRIRQDGNVETVAGIRGSSQGSCATFDANTTNCLATQLDLSDGQISGITTDPTGAIYLTQEGGGLLNRVLRITPDGFIRVFAGVGGSIARCSTTGFGDGGSLGTAGFTQPWGLMWDSGSLYVADTGDYTVRKLDGDPASGLVSTVVGTHCDGDYTEGGIAVGSPGGPVEPSDTIFSGVARSPDGSLLYNSVDANGRPSILKVRLPPGTSGDNATLLVPSDDAGEVYQFDDSTGATAGRHLATLGAVGGAPHYSFGYDSYGRLNQITEACAQQSCPTTTIAYSAAPSGCASSTVTITAPHGQVTTLGMDPNCYLSTVTSPKTDEITQLSHTASGLLTRLTDAIGHIHTFTYSATGLLTKDTSPLGIAGTRLTRTGKDGGWHVDFTSPQGRTVSHIVDDTRSKASDTAPTRVDHRTHTDLNGLETTDDRYDDLSRVVTYPDATTVTSNQTPDPRFGYRGAYVSKTVVETGTMTGSAGWEEDVARTTVPANPTSPLMVDSLTDTVTLNGKVWTTTRTRSPNHVLVTSPLGREVQLDLDASDQLTGVEFPGTGLLGLQVTYDNADGPAFATQVKTVSRGTRSVQYNYATALPTAGWLSSIDTPLGTPTASFTGRDNAGRATQETLLGNRVVNLGYDLNGNMTSLRMPLDSGGNYEHDFTPNVGDLLQTYTPPGGASTSYTYDMDGALLSDAPPGATPITYSYDAGGRLQNMTYSDPAHGAVSVDYAYYPPQDPAAGHVHTIVAQDGSMPTVTLTEAYDGSLMTSEATTGPFSHGVEYGYYDKTWRLSDRTLDNDQTTLVHYDYDDDGAIHQVSLNGATYIVNHDSATGMLTDTSFGGTLTDSYGYDTSGYGDVTSYDFKANGQSLFKIDYGRDPATGRLDTKNETYAGGGTCNWTYTYDPGGTKTFLTEALSQGTSCANGASDDTWTYDADGNYLNQDGTTPHYDTQDRLTDDMFGPCAYTPNGETTNWAGLSYVFDPLGNLRQDADDYLVDGRNRLIGKYYQGTLQVAWVYDDQGRIIAQTDGNGTITEQFVYVTKSNVPDLMARKSNGWTVYRLVSDQIGSVRRVVDAQGNVVESLDYTAWGGGIPQVQPFGFAGGLWDPDAFSYRFGARNYNFFTGRWLSKDLTRQNGGLNLYGYCNNDPVNCIDADGHNPFVIAGLIVLAGSLLSTDQPHDLTTADEVGAGIGVSLILAPALAEWLGGTWLGRAVLNTLGYKGAEVATEAEEGGQCASGPQQVATVIDPNKLNHIFGKAGHNLGPLLESFGGSQEATFAAVDNATQAAVRSQGLSGVFTTNVDVAGQIVAVRGRAIDGVAHIGSFWIP